MNTWIIVAVILTAKYVDSYQQQCVPLPHYLRGISESKCDSKLLYPGVSCRYRCKSGYKIVGFEKYTCMKDGRWNNNFNTRCEPVTCSLKERLSQKSLNMRCDHAMGNGTIINGAKCIFQCQKGYRLKGKPTITCQATGEFDDTQIQTCEQILCPKLAKSDSTVKTIHNNAECFNGPTRAGHRCIFECPVGYVLKGRHVIDCDLNGQWRPSSLAPKCVDRMPPQFSNDMCKNEIVLKEKTLVGRNYGSVLFSAINVTDNSGDKVMISCIDHFSGSCNYQLGKSSNMKIGDHRINIKAEDSAGNLAVCRIRVIVQDREPPKLLSCPDNIVRESYQPARISWKEPTYTDNCGKYPDCAIQVRNNIWSGSMFQTGTYNVAYTAVDPSDNRNEDCKFKITVKPPPPVVVDCTKFKNCLPKCLSDLIPCCGRQRMNCRGDSKVCDEKMFKCMKMN